MPVDATQFIKGLGDALDKARAAAVKEVSRFGQHVIGDAQELAPVDTGALKASGTAEPAEIDGNLITVRMGFNVDYAAAVHERPDLDHDQGQAKFLSAALEKNAPLLAPAVAAAVNAALG